MRSLILYLLLVVIPLAILVAILTGGRHLVAPSSIGGKWVISKEGIDDKSYCSHLVISGNEPQLSITQSGCWIDVQFNDAQKTLFKGQFQGSNLYTQTVKLVEAKEEFSNCVVNHRLSLNATIVPQGKETKLSGMLKVDGCDNCANVTFTATRIVTQK